MSLVCVMDPEIGTWDSVLLENLTEDCFINNIHQRYKNDQIYTYIGTSIVAINPYHHISEDSLDIIRTYGFKGLFQLPPHIYGLANLAYQSLNEQNEDQCIILLGEIGSGKTESFKMIVNFLTRIQENLISTTPSRSPILKQTQLKSDTNAGGHHGLITSSSPNNFASCKLTTTSSAVLRRKSSSPGVHPRRGSNSMLMPLRAESSERNSKKSSRERVVDFDFSHHKSSEYISESEIHGSTCYTAKKQCLPLSGANMKPAIYLSTLGISGCHLCGHSKCNRAQIICNQKEGSPFKTNSVCGSCFNLDRHQQISDDSQTRMFFANTASNQRLSLYETHRLQQNLEQKHSVKSREKTFDQKLRERVTCADVFLEAMGNATTIQNNNSSRYGKLFDIEIDFKGDPIGVRITHYTRYKCKYRNIEKYELLKNTTAFEEDRVNFYYTKKSLEILGLDSDEVNIIFRIIASVLKLGNLIFVPVTNIDGTEGCQISNIYELEEISHLLQLEDQKLLDCLTRGNIFSNGRDDLGSEIDARQASGMRYTLCRTLYSRLFSWLVNKINDALKSTKRERNLALLDFYGFEVMENNSFEQFIINYSSEKIHQHFVSKMLKAEQDLYQREGLEWSRIDFYDNESICELIDKPNYGILSLINESHLNTDEALMVRIQQCCAGHPNFITKGSNFTCFRIRHFANVVKYNINQFLSKNTDLLPKSISRILYQSEIPLLQNLFPEGNPRRQSNKTPSPLSCNVRNQLQTVLSVVRNRRCHYVFCIKPNDSKQPKAFDLALVQHQVRYMNLMPLVNLCRTGHCFHLTHTKFFNRYKSLNTITWPHFHGGNTIEGIALIIRNVPLPSAEFTIGTKSVFIRSPRTVYELEQFRKARLNDLSVLVQKTFRMYVHRKRFVRMRQSQIIISGAWRTWRVREEYRTMKYKKQAEWASYIITRYYRRYKIRQYLLMLPLCLPANSLSPLSTEWPVAPTFLTETSTILRSIYHRWRCYLYRNSFDQTSRNRMREKVTASIIFKDRKASYFTSVGHPFVGDYVRLRHNPHWKKICCETNDQYVVFADIINKITRSSGKFVPIILVLSTSSLLLLDQRTLQIKYRVPASEIYRMSLSPYLDDIAVFHVKASEFGRRKGDFIFQTSHVIEIVTKMFLVIQNAIGKPPEVQICTEFEANFGHQTVIFSFKYYGMPEMNQGQPKVLRKGNKMEVIV